jgi:putative ABC transport system permease protein
MSLTTGVRVFVSRVLDVVLRRRRDDRLAEEVQTHLDLLTQDYIGRGMTPADARLAARRAFGGVDQVTAVYREQRGLPLVDTVAHDVRFAARLLGRDRGFTLTAVLVLGVGIGVNNMLFTILNAHTIRGLPIHRVDRVMYISTFDDRTPERGLPYPDFVDLQNAAHTFTGIAAFTSAPVTVSGDGQAAERLEAAFASANAFALLGVQPVLGRGLTLDDDRSGAAAVVLLGTGVWRARFGADPTVVGRSIVVNGAPAIVAGVIPDRSGFPSSAAIWLPLSQAPGVAVEKRDTSNLRVFGRVRDGVTVADARAEVEAIVTRLSRDDAGANGRLRARVVPINERFLGRATDPAWRAFITVGFLIVLISCANVANLMLGRSVHRAREIAIRASLGASRRRIVGQLLIEGALLAAIGGAVGLAFAVAGVRVFRSAIPENVLPYWLDYSIDARVLGGLVAVSTATVFVFALLPAIRASKTDVNRVLKDGGRPGFSVRGTGRLMTAFLAAEFALAVVLLAQVVVSFRSNPPRVPSDAVIDTADVLTAAITLPPGTYQTAAERVAFHRQLAERARAIPGVSSIAVASTLPLMGGPEAQVDILARPRAAPEFERTVRTVYVGPGYFDTLGVGLVRGRDFQDGSGTPGHAHAIVNERLAKRFFRDDDPVGQRIAVTPVNAAGNTHGSLTIIAVAPDVRQRPTPEPDPVVYLPYDASPASTAAVLVRSRTTTRELLSSLRNVLVALDPNLPLDRVRTMSGLILDAWWNARLSHLLVLALTAIAVGLSTGGLYAATAYAVSQRTPEIGIRMALGAQPRDVVIMIVRRALVQLALGFGLGMVCTIGWSRMFASGRPAVHAADPQPLLAIAAILMLAALVACFVPARRAARLDPVVAIRGD